MREELGGRVIYIGRRTLKYVKSFKYLGMLLFTNDQIFAALVTDKVWQVTVTSAGIRTSSRLSLCTALALLELKALIRSCKYN